MYMAGMLIKDRESKYLQFKTKYLNKRLDFDGVYGYQCVDLAKYYTKEVYGINLSSFGGSAYTGYLNENKTFDSRWKKVPYIKGMIPVSGDIIFFKPTTSNSYGHVGIAGISDVNNITILEQNYVSGKDINFGKGTGQASIQERKRSYKDFAGSWRYIG